MTGSRNCHTHSYTPHYGNDVPFEVPESWEWCKLIDVCHIFGRIGFRGYTKDDFVSNDGAITLSPSNIIDGQMNYDNCSYISWEKYEESPEIQIANGDILLVKTGSSFGKCAYVCNLPQKATINPQFVVLKYILCNPVFLTYMLQSGYARRNYDEFVLGTAIPTFTQAALGNMYIPLPSKQEQQRIVNAIGQWFKFIDDLEKEQNGLQRLFQLTKSKILDLAIHGKLVPQDPDDEPAIELLKRINPSFVPCDNGHDTNKLPSGWEKAKLKEICQIIMGSSPSGENINSNKNGVEFHQGKLFFTDLYLNTSNTYTDSVTKLAPKNSILLCVRAPVGIVNISSRSVCIGRGLCAIVPQDEMNLMFLFYAIQALKPFFEENATGTTFKAIGGDIVRESFILLPPSNEQLRIVAKIEEIFAILDEIQKSIED